MAEGKVCVTCHDWVPLAGYNRRARSPDGSQARCRACCRAWYAANNVAHKRNVRVRNDLVRQQWQQRLAVYFTAHPCVDCREPDLRVLEFDHREPSLKTAEIGRLLAASMSWTRIQAEIDKCDVRCSNCHRIRTMGDCASWRVAAEVARRSVGEAAASARLASLLSR